MTTILTSVFSACDLLFDSGGNLFAASSMVQSSPSHWGQTHRSLPGHSKTFLKGNTIIVNIPYCHWDLYRGPERELSKVTLLKLPSAVSFIFLLYTKVLSLPSIRNWNPNREKVVTQDNLTKQELLWNHFWTKKWQHREQKRTSTFKKANTSAAQRQWITNHCRLIRCNSGRGL